MPDPAKHISLQVCDQQGIVYTVRLTVAEQNEAGSLSILTASGVLAQQFELTHLKKDKDGTRLTCNVRGATASLSLERNKVQPQLRVSASLFSQFLTPCITSMPQSKSDLWRGLMISELAS